MYKPKEYWSANQRNYLEEPILLQPLVAPDQSKMLCQLSMINQSYTQSRRHGGFGGLRPQIEIWNTTNQEFCQFFTMSSPPAQT